MPALAAIGLPRRAPARVLACGAFLKNTAGLLIDDQLWLSPLHDDLSDPSACAALERSIDALLAQANGRIDAVAHDLHPDFHSSRVAVRTAAALGVPAIAVQHHHAHIAAVQAEQGWTGEPVVGLALDGVGLGTDGTAWGGEVLAVRGGQVERTGHLPALAMPGGDVAAREPWRMAASALHALGRGDEIVPRFTASVGEPRSRGVQIMLSRRLNCPLSSGAGRWFDAAAGALGLSVRQSQEAEAAIALEACATEWLARHPAPELTQTTLDLLPVLDLLFDTAHDDHARGEAAARFHVALAAGLVAEARRAAQRSGTALVALGGGCFFNRLLSSLVQAGLEAAGLRAHRPQRVSCGDAGLALGQAWAAALQLDATTGDGATRAAATAASPDPSTLNPES
ncbi:carbamoyltransferase HypF [Ideonella sp. A 288]|uniref:Kae1-like domain-containing protein n=1 Tax=Ideonella sp. A 288 TaxID=1962181 RepID=UPI0013031D82|nr:carbamoyltransferase HypF [Ideonella sp. A 288]